MSKLTEMEESVCRFKHLNTLYKTIYYYGSSVIALYEWKKTGRFFKSWNWELIYFGHSTPLESAINFYHKEKAKDTVLSDRMSNRCGEKEKI